jgi:perosamine synthetase
LSDEVAAVLVINFCGFDADIGDLLAYRKKYGFYVIEDCSHSFLKNAQGELTGDRGDVAVYSFYKLVPSYAGGGVRINNKELLFPPSGERLNTKQQIIAVKRMLEQIIENFDGGFLKSTFHRIENARVKLKRPGSDISKEEAALVEEAYLFNFGLAKVTMPWFSRAVLGQCDFRNLVLARRRNFDILNDFLQESRCLKKVFSALPDNVCPWAYPVMINNRSEYDRRLRAIGVPLFTFGELLHPSSHRADRAVAEDAALLSRDLMMIPVHQNLICDDVAQISDKLNSFFSSEVD